MNLLTSQALELARSGLAVFPCGRSKTPNISSENGGRGFHDASTEPEEIERLFAAPGSVFIGVPTGEISGWDALDIDPRDGGDVWEAENLYRLPETRIHQSQGGGRHYIFKHAPGVRNRAGKSKNGIGIAPGVDVRGSGGYICMPPSPGYSIISDAEVAEWPDWLLAEVLPKVREDIPPQPSTPRQPMSSKRLDGLISAVLRRVTEAGDGNKHFTLRNQALYLGGIQHIAGFTTAEAVQWLLDALPPIKNRSTAEATARWGVESGAKNPIELEDRPHIRPTQHQAEAPPDYLDEPPPHSEQQEPRDDPEVIDLGAHRTKRKLFDMLVRSDSGIALPTVSNMIIILRNDPRLANLVTLNEFTFDTAILRAPPKPEPDAPDMPGPYPRGWTEADEALILAYIQAQWTPRANDKALRAAMIAEAAMRSFHPVRDWLDTLQWDGIHRLDTWLHEAFGCEKNQYTTDIGAKFMIAAVRRIRRPGCKFDFMLVFEGAQGIGKSTAIKTLFSEEWFSDSIMHDLGHKDAAIGLIGVWGLELAEIDQLIRNDVEVIKAFLARATDKYRPPFGRQDVTRPRQGVIIGTTNSSDYLRDATGNRRFWPAACLKADVEWIAANRIQLWAEATARNDMDEPIWLEDPTVQAFAAEEQAARLIEDNWSERIGGWVMHKAYTTTSDVLADCLEIPVKDRNRFAEMRVASILKLAGWKNSGKRENGKVVRKWRRIDENGLFA